MIRLPTKPGKSLTMTGLLPSFLARSYTVWAVSGAVARLLTTSTSAIRGAGLKKCMPQTLVGRFVIAPIAVTGSEEVLEARIVCSGHRASIFWKMSFLIFMFSTTASTTRSTLQDAASSSTTPQRFLYMAALASAVSLPFSTILPRFFSMLAIPLSTNFWSMSCMTTSKPPCSMTWAMPLPI